MRYGTLTVSLAKADSSAPIDGGTTGNVGTIEVIVLRCKSSGDKQPAPTRSPVKHGTSRTKEKSAQAPAKASAKPSPAPSVRKGTPAASGFGMMGGIFDGAGDDPADDAGVFVPVGPRGYVHPVPPPGMVWDATAGMFISEEEFAYEQTAHLNHGPPASNLGRARGSVNLGGYEYGESVTLRNMRFRSILIHSSEERNPQLDGCGGERTIFINQYHARRASDPQRELLRGQVHRTVHSPGTHKEFRHGARPQTSDAVSERSLPQVGRKPSFHQHTVPQSEQSVHASSDAARQWVIAKLARVRFLRREVERLQSELDDLYEIVAESAQNPSFDRRTCLAQIKKRADHMESFKAEGDATLAHMGYGSPNWPQSKYRSVSLANQSFARPTQAPTQSQYVQPTQNWQKAGGGVVQQGGSLNPDFKMPGQEGTLADRTRAKAAAAKNGGQAPEPAPRALQSEEMKHSNDWRNSNDQDDKNKAGEDTWGGGDQQNNGHDSWEADKPENNAWDGSDDKKKDGENWGGDNANDNGNDGWSNNDQQNGRSGSAKSSKRGDDWGNSSNKGNDAWGRGSGTDKGKKDDKTQSWGGGAQQKSASTAATSVRNWSSDANSKPTIKPYWAEWRAPAGNSGPGGSTKHEHARNAYEYPAPPPPISSTGKGNGASHGVQPGKGASYAHRCHRPDYLDDMKAPYAIFSFKYRSKATLEKLMSRSISADVAPIMEQAERDKWANLPKNKLVDELMKLRAPQISGKSEGSQVAAKSQKAASNAGLDATPAGNQPAGDNWGSNSNKGDGEGWGGSHKSGSNKGSKAGGWDNTPANGAGWDGANDEKIKVPSQGSAHWSKVSSNKGDKVENATAGNGWTSGQSTSKEKAVEQQGWANPAKQSHTGGSHQQSVFKEGRRTEYQPGARSARTASSVEHGFEGMAAAGATPATGWGAAAGGQPADHDLKAADFVANMEKGAYAQSGPMNW